MQEVRRRFQKRFTVPVLHEDGDAVQNVAGNEVKSARKVNIGPFLSHEEACE